MALRWFRENKGATRWMYIILTVFVMLTFSVTGAVTDWFGGSPEIGTAGSFVLPSGTKVEVNEIEFRKVQQDLSRVIDRRMFDTDEDVWAFVMADRLAAEAGVRISDSMLATFLDQQFDQAQIPRKDRNEAYRSWIRNSGLSAAEFDRIWKRVLRVNVYSGLVAEQPRTLSKDVFEQFQQAAELLTVDYVSFVDADYAAKIDRATITDEQLTSFLANDMERIRRQREFSTPPAFRIDAAYLDAATADVATLEALLDPNQRTFQDWEMTRAYEERKEARYRLPAPETPATPAEGETPSEGEQPAEGEKPAEGETPAEGDAPAEGEAPAESEPPAEDAEPQYRPLEDVREEIRKELLIQRVLGKALSAYQAKLATKRAAAAQKAAAGEGAPPVEETPEVDPFVAIATEFGLEYLPPSDSTPLPDLATLPRIGSERIVGQIEFAEKDAALPVFPDAERRAGFLMRVFDKVDAVVKPVAEVRDALIEPYVEGTASKQAEEAAKEFVAALAAATRVKVATEIEAIEKEARDRATTRIAEQKIEDEAAKQKAIDDELAQVQWRIDTLLDDRKHEAFDEVVAAKGLPLGKVGPYRRSYSRSGMFQLEPPGPARFVMSQAALGDLEPGQVSNPLRDFAGKQSVVARLVAKERPTHEQMTALDRQRAQMGIMQRQYMEMQQRNDPVSFARLALLLDLKRADPERPPS